MHFLDKKQKFNEMKKFIEAQGLEVHSNTKAKGHQGFFKNNRIDISKTLDEAKKISVLAHEFAHFIHNNIEKDMSKTGGSLNRVFDIEDCSIINNELSIITTLVDESSELLDLKKTKANLIQEIKSYDELIKTSYPNYNKNFQEFDKYIKKSKAKYFLKYDKIKFVTPFLKREEIYCIENIEKDFSKMPLPFIAFLKMISLKRKRAKISKRINKYKKYYAQPNELFARFIECFFINPKVLKLHAPFTLKRFYDLLESNYYGELKYFLQNFSNTEY